MAPERVERGDTYDVSVFVNCPFDDEYQPMFEAIVFAVQACGFMARCALEAYDAGVVRIEKIASLIRSCRWGVHDISRTELSPAGLPRFNMPFELGLFLGAARFGNARQRRKTCVVLDRARYRYQSFLSDIAGQDIQSHEGKPARAVGSIRSWFASEQSALPIPGGADINRRYAKFKMVLPLILNAKRLTRDEMTFADYTGIVAAWLAPSTGVEA